MTHVITRACCNDAACVSVCPKNCIHPRPGDPDFATAEMLRIDPATCIDCGACVEVCPVSAIVPDFQLRPDESDYLTLNAEHFANLQYAADGFSDPAPPSAVTGLSVAVVGSGPAAMYAVEHLLEALDESGVIHVYERLPVPWGLVRFGVAPDHQDTKQVARGFERLARDPRVHVHLNVDIGSDISHEQLAASHHAVVYGVGAPGSRALGIPGEDLPGCVAATEFVAWYNGHPDAPNLAPALSGRRAIIIGNGNVALDVARILGAGDRNLEESDVAPDALASLESSSIEEIVVLARRGPAEAAYTTPELLSLIHHGDLDVHVEGLDDHQSEVGPLKERLVARVAAGELGGSKPARRRVVLRFLSSPTRITGDSHATGVVVARNELIRSETGVRARQTDDTELLEGSLIIHAVGYAGAAVPGLPFDDQRALIPNESGRVMTGASPMAGTYVVGWSKRGPSGVIGTNKSCARETVDALLDDASRGLLPTPTSDPDLLTASLTSALQLSDWHTIDAHEREHGRQAMRPRLKITDHDRLVDVARSRA